MAQIKPENENDTEGENNNNNNKDEEKIHQHQHQHQHQQEQQLQHQQLQGSPIWMSPEVMLRQSTNHPARDVYAFSLILWEISSFFF